MRDKDRTRAGLVEELEQLRQRLSELQAAQPELRSTIERLQESEEMYRTLVRTSPDAVTVTDLEGRITHVSERTLELHGFDRAKDMIGMSSLDLIAPGDRERAVEGIEKTLKIGYMATREYTLLRRDGTTFVGELSASMIKDAQGKPRAFIGTTRDVTARKRMEEALRTSEEKYRDLVENINDVIYSLDKDGVITYMSPTVEFVSGYKPKELVGRPFHEFIYEEDLPQAITNFQANLSGRIEPNEFRVVLKSGEIRWARSSNRPVFAGDKLVGLQGVISDITDRKTAARRAQFLGSIAEQAKDAFIVTDLDFKIIYINSTAEQLYGYSMRELEGKTPDVVNAEPNAAEIQADIYRTVSSLGIWTGTLLNRRKDGSTFICELKVAPLRGEDGEITSYLGIQRDVTERKKLEEQLLQAQKMEAVGTLAGGIAHDFNNMLTAIIGYSELLLASCDEDSALRADVKEIGSVARRAASLTRQLLSFSRRQIIQVAPIDLSELVVRMEPMLRRLIGEDIELIIETLPNLPAVNADAGQIEQAVMNLALNARDAMPDGGRLTIVTKAGVFDEEACKVVSEAKPGGCVCLSVADTGTGIEKDVMQHIFEPFYTTKPTGQGTGLGLSVVYGVVRQHEGRVEVHSRPGQGCVVQVCLPAAAGEIEEQIQEKVAALDVRGNGERILLVEDEEGVRKLAARALGSKGFVVFEAANAAEAADILDREEGRFDLVFCDVVLPDRSGVEFAEELRSSGRGVPILLTSGYTDRRLQWPVIEKRGYKFLSKPYELVDLVRAVKDAMKAS